ncbi:portal protein [Acinetobacter sp. YH12081]|uniref:portal protein n=1 Tax=Acinetobacter sp. YH12081 TaxID=2601074 RepID=UPI0015D21C96|nr:portal protein [Acinetobacter sp. YH12081]
MEKQDKDLLTEIIKFRDDAQNYWQPIYNQGLKDKRFVTLKGEQWDKKALEQRKAQGKPTLEINLVRTYVQQQINTMRQNRPQAKVVPVDSGADPETAKVLEGLIKDVEEASNFENALDIAAANQVHAAVGFYRITTDYINEKSFNQEPQFKSIENPQAVLIDPLSRSLDGSDMTKALVCEWVDKDQIAKDYGDDTVSDFEMDKSEEWTNTDDNTVCIAEYFYKDEVKDTLLMLEDGSTEFKSVLLKQWTEDDLKQLTVNERETTRTEIKWAKVSGVKILETGVFPGEYIPIFPVYGEVTWVENKRHVFSLVHFAKDAQRLFNYWKSTEAHILQKNQDEMTIVDDRGIAGFEEWQNPSGAAYLRFKATDDNGNQIPYPTKLGAAAPPVGILNASENAKTLIPDILNMHAPQMGQDVNQQSGVAIGLLQRQSDTAQFHFQDNLNKTIRHSARVLVGLFPILYDTEMVRRIVGADGDSELVRLNAVPQTPDEQTRAINGILNDMSIGRFDIRMDTGPSFNTQREQSFALMMQLVQSNPALFNLVADLIVINSPLLNAKEIAERVKMLVPAQALGKDKIDPEQAKAQIAQLDQLVQKMTADLEALQGQLNDKNAERNVEIFKAELQAQKDIQVAQINAASRADVQELRGVVDLIKQNINWQNTPPNWTEQGEGVDSYAPSQPILPQSDGFEPPPDMTQTSLQDPAAEQGFLMPEESAQEQFAPEISQFGESATAENGGMPPLENLDGSEQF